MPKKSKSQQYQDALKDLDAKPDSFFGTKRINFDDLPCIKDEKPTMLKRTNYIDKRVVDEINRVAEEKNINKTELLNDILRAAIGIE